MKEKHTGKALVERTDWDRLGKRTDREIRNGLRADLDSKPTSAEFWKTAQIRLPRPKQPVTIRLDADLLQWFRQAEGYQTRINAVLRSYMEAQQR